MAIQTRYAGDANGINNVDAKYDGTLGTIIATGLTKNPTAIKITLGLGQTFQASDSATGGPVESILRQIGIDSTIVMYQVDSSQLSVLVEATGAATPVATTLATRIATLANASAALGTGNVWANAATVSTTNNFKLA
jgi:hypothetical protein